jgi:ABC-type hemin transport system ATPase subunit
MTDTRAHPDWCAKGHRCGLGEHRAQPVRLDAPGRGVLVLTRVQDASGAQHVEIRTRIRLAPGESQARAHLARILAELNAHLRRVTALR